MRIKWFLAGALQLLAAGLWLFYQTAAVASRGGEDTPLYSAERHDPYGTAALKDLLTERGVPTSLLLRPLPDETTGTVLVQVVSGASMNDLKMPHPQLERWKAWIERGNTFVQFTRIPTPLMEEYHLSGGSLADSVTAILAAESRGKPQDQIPAGDELVRWDPTGRAGAAAHLPRVANLDFYSAQILTTAPESQWEPLAVKGAKDWVAAQRPVGKGRFIVVGTPTPALNGMLGTASNMEFVLSLLAPGGKAAKSPVMFDEWSHGLGHERTIIGFIREVGLMPSLLQLFFVVALYVWATSGFSQPDAAAGKRRRSSSEQIETLGHLYRQAMKPEMVFARVYAEVRGRLAAALRSTPAALEATLAKAAPATANRARIILEQLHGVGRGRGPTCPACGYDLTQNNSGTCPECGAAIPWKIKERIAHAQDMTSVPDRQMSKRKVEARLAAALRESHQFVEEFARDRNRRT